MCTTDVENSAFYDLFHVSSLFADQDNQNLLSLLKQQLFNDLLSCFKYSLMSDLVNEFNDYREKMNEVILSKNNLVMKRLWNLDTNTYEDGALDKKTKEMLGLVASMVLRCDDCIKYHLGKSYELGVTTEQMYEIFAVANIVGGTIVIPHTRRAAEYWEALQKG
jgi:AhpD family alkylhydroperoxidase